MWVGTFITIAGYIAATHKITDYIPIHESSTNIMFKIGSILLITVIAFVKLHCLGLACKVIEKRADKDDES